MLEVEISNGSTAPPPPPPPTSPLPARLLLHIPSLSTPDADDPDLDALLADLCQLEEDTKAQLASTTTSTLETGGDRQTVNLGEPKQPR